MRLVKIVNLVVLLAGLTANAALAVAGPGASGGGDICEDHFKVVRDDIFIWIKDGGPRVGKISLPPGITVEHYSEAMLRQIYSAKIRCVGPGDDGYPVEIDGTPKVCRFDLDPGQSRITCDISKFEQLKDPGRYILVHHEYAGLAKLESPKGDDSSYVISNQISAYLDKQWVSRLAVRPARLPLTKKSISGHTFVQVTDQPELGNAWKDESGVIWGDRVTKDDMTQDDVSKYCNKDGNSGPCYMSQQKAAAYCNVIGAHLPTKDQFAQLANYLGASESGYNPEIIPNLIENAYWSASVIPHNSDQAYYFNGNNGTFLGINRHYGESVRCIGQ